MTPVIGPPDSPANTSPSTHKSVIGGFSMKKLLIVVVPLSQADLIETPGAEPPTHEP